MSETKTEIEAYKWKICFENAYIQIKQIDHTLNVMQHNLAKIGCDYIAFGPIAYAMGNVAEAMCEIKKVMEE